MSSLFTVPSQPLQTNATPTNHTIQYDNCIELLNITNHAINNIYNAQQLNDVLDKYRSILKQIHIPYPTTQSSQLLQSRSIFVINQTTIQLDPVQIDYIYKFSELHNVDVIYTTYLFYLSAKHIASTHKSNTNAQSINIRELVIQ